MTVNVSINLIEPRIARLTFSNPSQRNALSAQLLDSLDESLVALAAQHVGVERRPRYR